MTVKDETCLADDSSSNDVSTVDLMNKQHLLKVPKNPSERMESVLHNPKSNQSKHLSQPQAFQAGW